MHEPFQRREPASQPDQHMEGKPIERLCRVPIHARYLTVMQRVLAEHGASLRETKDAPPVGSAEDTRMYEAVFPEGTMRVNGLVMLRSVPFELVFPDGYRLQGAELWPITLRDSDVCINGLMLVPEEIETKKEGEQ